MGVTIQFLGAAGTVTGSRFLVSDGRHRVLVDCGLFQGLKELRLRNWEPFPFDSRSIDAVVLTHAHLDHCGGLPLLVRQGFRGQVLATSPTRDLAELILLDSAHLHEEDAEVVNRRGYSRHSPARPLFTVPEAQEAMKHFRPTPADHWIEMLPGWRLRFQKSGHILGSAFIELEVRGRLLVFSGDLGRQHPLTLAPPARLKAADYLVLESTYGDRQHPSTDVADELASIITETAAAGGQLLIPTFAVGRTQDLLYLLSMLRKRAGFPQAPVFLDTPLGTRATEVFHQHVAWQRLGADELSAMSEVATVIKSQQQSLDLIHRHEPAIVLAGSGMITGGRILKHLEARLADPRNTVLLVGFQAAGTRGRQLEEGATELKMFGRYVAVAARVPKISGLSAHADQGEILRWLDGFEGGRHPRRTFLVHGEPHAADALRVKIRDSLGWRVEVAQDLATETLE